PRALEPRRRLEFRHHRAALQIVPPEFRLEPRRRGGVVGLATANSLNFGRPVMSLLRVVRNVVENPLLAAIQAHGGNVQGPGGKTTENPRPTAALHFRRIHERKSTR